MAGEGSAEAGRVLGLGMPGRGLCAGGRLTASATAGEGAMVRAKIGTHAMGMIRLA